FMALDLVLFFVFYELMLLPMYFLIGIWGGSRSKYAAIKFVIYTLLGSVFILIAIIALYFTNVRDFVDQQIVQARAEEIRKENPLLTIDQARDKATVHTFDFVTLQKVGQAAYLKLNGQEGRIAAARPAGAETTATAPEPGKPVELLGRGATLAAPQN